MITITITLGDAAEAPPENVEDLIAHTIAQAIRLSFDAGAVRGKDGELLGSWSVRRSPR